MTNVRTLRRNIFIPNSQLALPGCRACVTYSSLLLRAIGAHVVGLCAIALLLCIADSASAQDFTFGRTPAGRASGSASEVVNTNARGMGMNFRAGHEAGSTVGRDQSATQLGLSPYVNIGDGLFFGDSRMMYANDGGLTWSLGTGYRQYIPAWDAIVGGYGYYDWDDVTGADFKQWSVGAEILAYGWEARANLYRPYGNTSAQTGSRVDSSSAAFVGDTIVFDRIDTFSEALEGFDAEVGFLLPGEVSERFDLRAFGGGYQYSGDGQSEFGGFSTRLQADVGDWLELGLKLTDDEVFNTNVSFSAVVHFGGYHSQAHTSRSAMQRMAEPVRRNLSIASSVADIRTGGVIAENTDGTQLRVVHVNSTVAAGGAGTVEDPFSQLSTGLGAPDSDIVFVHAGSSFTSIPDNTATLADGQSLFGEGLIAGTGGNRRVTNTVELSGIGELELPDSPTFAADLASLGPSPFGPLAESTAINSALLRPTLSGSGGDGVTLGNNSQIGGFIINEAGGHGILIDSVSGVTVRDVDIINASGSGILVQNSAFDSTTTILDTIITGAAGASFHVAGGAGAIGFNSTAVNLDPSRASIVNGSNESVLIENRTGGSVNMQGATIDGDGGAGIVIRDTVGDATIDNASIVNSTSTGISISNSTGNFAFRNSIRSATVIDQAMGDSFDIDGVGAGSNVTVEDLSITNRMAGGVDVNNLGGSLSVTQALDIGAQSAGTDAAISIANSEATGAVRFSDAVTVRGSGGRGVELVSNAAGSTFNADGLVTVVSAGAESIAIQDHLGVAEFSGGASISNRGLTGILIENSSGTVLFDDNTVVANQGLVDDAGVIIRNSESLVQFGGLSVTNAGAQGGVDLQDNVAGADGPGRLQFEALTITSDGGVGLQADNNTSIRVEDGTISSTGAAAVDIANSGIDITLESVSSADSPDVGIRLVETNVESDNTFTVTGDLTLQQPFGTGGVISGAASSGISLENAGQVSLAGMLLNDNNFGAFVRNSGVTEDDEQFLSLRFVQMQDSAVRGIDAENLTQLNVRDSIFNNNGNSAVGNAGPDGVIQLTDRESIFLNYTELTNDDDTVSFSQFDFPYLVNVERTTFLASTDDAIRITNASSATGAHVDINVANNMFTMNDTLDIGTDVDETAVVLDWNGVARINIFGNSVSLQGQTEGEVQTAFDIRNDSFTDDLLVDVVSNVITNSTQPEAVGLNLSANAATSALIDNNAFTFAGEESTGMQFDLATNTEVAIVNNTLLFQNDGGNGIMFSMVEQPSVFTISNNDIGLTDLALTTQEIGIQFQIALGTPILRGNLNNEIILLNPGIIPDSGGQASNIDIDFQIPRSNGRILINGALRP